jgi:hypothetical protein
MGGNLTAGEEVMLELQRETNERLGRLELKVGCVSDDVAELKATARWWGGVSGIISAIAGHIGLLAIK